MARSHKAGEERIKHLATYLNGLSLGFAGFAGIRPAISDEPVLWGYILAAIVLHAIGHYLLGYLKEDVT